jgi:chorismate synthase
LPLDEAALQRELDLRRPGRNEPSSTTRKEPDTVRLLSGVFGGRTTGAPIAFHIANQDQRSGDYEPMAEIWRPGHADLAYDAKYGLRDHRGGGRASARETAARVAGGAVAQVFLAGLGIRILACARELGGLAAPDPMEADWGGVENRPYFAACDEIVPAWDEKIREARKQGDTLGGIVYLEARGVPAGLGEPVFHKLDAVLAQALMGVGAVKAVEVGEGFAAARMLGSRHNDELLPSPEGAAPLFASNHAGGVLGGISTGQPIILRAAVKPVPSVSRRQASVDRAGNAVSLRIGGRHDICAIPRIVPVLKAMTALVLADMILLQRRMEPGAGMRPHGRPGACR